MEIRTLNPEDREEVEEIFYSTDGEEGLKTVDNTWEVWMDSMNHPCVMVDDRIVGFTNLCFVKNVAWIEDFRIHRKYQGRGYGTKILEYCQDLAHDCRYMGLDVYSDNEKACSFYDRRFFSVLFSYLRLDAEVCRISSVPVSLECDNVWEFIRSSPQYRCMQGFSMFNHYGCPLTEEDVRTQMEQKTLFVLGEKEIESVLLFEVCKLWVDHDRILFNECSLARKYHLEDILVINGIYGDGNTAALVDMVFSYCSRHSIHFVRAYPLWGSEQIQSMVDKGFEIPPWEKKRHFIAYYKQI